MRFSLDEVLRAKAAARTAVIALPIAEKLRILERLRDRDQAIRRAVKTTNQARPESQSEDR
jgi:rRNA-processing protein FCF1